MTPHSRLFCDFGPLRLPGPSQDQYQNLAAQLWGIRELPTGFRLKLFLPPRTAPLDPIESLIIGLADPDASVRNRSALALVRLVPTAAAAVPALVTVLSDEDLSNRGMAALALRAIGPLAKDAVESLLRLAESEPFESVRATAIDSLSLIARSTPQAAGPRLQS